MHICIFIFFKHLFIFIVMLHVCLCLVCTKARRVLAILKLELWIDESCFWKLNPDPLEEYAMFLTVDPYLIGRLGFNFTFKTKTVISIFRSGIFGNTQFDSLFA